MKRGSRIRFAACACFFYLAACASINSAFVFLRRFNFDETNALSGWGKMVLNGVVRYDLIREGDDGFVEALSDKACSALYYRIGYRLSEWPLLSWQWRVERFPDKTNAKTEKERDDYAARVYVIFPFLSFSSSKFIEYVWDESLPVGTIKKSPAGANIRLIVVRSGKGDMNRWMSEMRNVYDDYTIAFGKKPKMNVGAIAIMCNADNTKSVAESSFDNITIVSLTGEKREVGKL